MGICNQYFFYGLGGMALYLTPILEGVFLEFSVRVAFP